MILPVSYKYFLSVICRYKRWSVVFLLFYRSKCYTSTLFCYQIIYIHVVRCLNISIIFHNISHTLFICSFILSFSLSLSLSSSITIQCSNHSHTLFPHHSSNCLLLLLLLICCWFVQIGASYFATVSVCAATGTSIHVI